MEQNFEARQPDYRGDGCAVWVNVDKNSQKYLTIKLLGSININCFKNEPKPKLKEEI